VHPDDRDRASRSGAALLRQKKYSHEYRIRHANGAYIWVLDQMKIVGDGSAPVMIGSWTDVSAGRLHQAQIEAAEAHYRRLIQTSPYSIFTLDDAGTVMEVNAAGERILGRTDLIGMNFLDLVPAREVQRARSLFEQVLADKGDASDLELHVRRPDGEERLLSIAISPIREESATGVHGIARDITGERAREEQLRRAERLATVGTLVAGVAHELNNPLTAIANFAELMLMEPHSDDEREMLQLTRREAERAARIVADLRLFARETQQVAPRSRSAVDLNDVVRHVLKLQRYSLQTSNIDVDVDLAADQPAVHGNASELEQVVLNLIVNAKQALSASHSGRRCISVRTHTGRAGAVLSIADTGPGIAKSQLDRIFDPFFTTKSPGEGMGLGLSLVHRIVTEHDGEIDVQSTPGAGAVFTVSLPLARSGDPVPMEVTARRTTALRILVVDDEVPIRRALLRFLQRRGHSVDLASEGREALQLIEQQYYDVILTDLRMPGMGGEMLLETLRERDPAAARRVMFMTGHVARDDAALTTTYADVPVIEKPFSLNELGDQLDELAARLREE
jgi:PAS domain S-box-containing protein